MERETGLEPATSSLGSWHSTTELLPRSVKSPILADPLDLLDGVRSIPPMLSIQYYPFRLQNGQQNRPHTSLAISRPAVPMVSISLSNARFRHTIAQCEEKQPIFQGRRRQCRKPRFPHDPSF